MRELYGKRMRGGLLPYGPPGCGKAFIARAVTGELGSRFMSVGLNDVLDLDIGQSERNLHEVFETARRNAPCVVFLDELDALGAKRGLVRHSGLRAAVNQLRAELDGFHAAANEGVFVLAATKPGTWTPRCRAARRTVIRSPPGSRCGEAPRRIQHARSSSMTCAKASIEGSRTVT